MALSETKLLSVRLPEAKKRIAPSPSATAADKGRTPGSCVVPTALGIPRAT